jgi:hypothetical protein
MSAVFWLLAISAAVGFLVGIYLSWLAIAVAGLILALGSAITLNINGFGDFAGIAITVATLVVSQVTYVTSGLNFTQNHRFEFAVAAAAGAVD